jgi:CubicO group peptidase (beta-lactamase class C family)
VWIDPAREIVAVLLTNATHPVVDLGKPVNALRARFANAVVAAIDM